MYDVIEYRYEVRQDVDNLRYVGLFSSLDEAVNYCRKMKDNDEGKFTIIDRFLNASIGWD